MSLAQATSKMKKAAVKIAIDVATFWKSNEELHLRKKFSVPWNYKVRFVEAFSFNAWLMSFRFIAAAKAKWKVFLQFAKALLKDFKVQARNRTFATFYS